MIEQRAPNGIDHTSPDEVLPEHEAGTDVPPLYPGVQRVMEQLKSVIDKYTAAGDLQHTPSGEPILSPDAFDEWAKEAGFAHGKRGTFNNGETYAYIKHCNFVPKGEDVDATLTMARHLTGLGAIHPESQWTVFETEQGDHQLVVVSPKLESWSFDADNDHPQRPQPDRSHIIEWYQRIDPNFVPGQPIPEGSLLYHLNWTEASKNENWGWDVTGTLFPVDVEVLRPGPVGPYKDPEPWKPKDIAPSHYGDW